MSTASKTAYSTIQSRVLEGKLPQGSSITELGMAELSGVSRTPVREALRQLEAEGLINRSDTGRLTVAEWQRADLDDVFALRAMLEGHVSERAAERISHDDIARLRQANARLFEAVSDGPDVVGFLAANREFHDIIISGSASERTMTMLRQLVEQPIVQATAHRYDQALFMRSYEEHEELIAALSCTDGIWAKAIMTSHVRRAYHALSALRPG